ncbi:MAG: hypothetical protein WBB01_16315 [Phormidesmis sp.]
MSRFRGRIWQGWKTLSLAAVCALSAGELPAYAQKVTIFDLDQAICANDWSDAIDVASLLVADETTPSAQRASLLTLRRQLENYRAENALIAEEQACDRTNPYLLSAIAVPTVQTGAPLGWEMAVAAATDNRYGTQVMTESEPFALPVAMAEPMGLTPAVPVDLSNGFNVVSGHVGSGHQVYGFVARRGDRLDANLVVTRVMTGSLYTSDDSQLFIFDSQGNLMAAVDDTDSTQQSRISGLTLPKTDLYFAVVTSYNNDPIFNSENRLAGWQDNGGGRFDYTLTLSGVTPTNALTR